MNNHTLKTVTTNKIAEYLLKIKAVSFRIAPPFVWSSGWKSPIYCDNRKALSYPNARNEIQQNFVDLIRDTYPEAEAIAGVATGAIAWGALVAQAMNLPMVYIRSKPKGHGMKNLIEGDLNPDLDYVVIEDLVSTGGSSIQAIEAMIEAGAKVRGTAAIFSYGFPEANQAFQSKDIPLHTLTNLESLLEKAVEFDYLQPDELETVRRWQQDPSVWS